MKPADDQKASLNRLLASETMKRAPRVRTVLKFILDYNSQGKSDQINEQRIGQSVFGRPEGYNPAEDNIVRVTVHNLRERLEEFYRTEGKAEHWILEIPKGKYAPMIRRRDIVLNRAEATSAPPEGFSTRRAYPFRRTRWLVWTGCLVCGTSLLAYTLLRNSRVPHPNTKGSESSGLIQTLFGHPGQRTTVVLADSDLQAYRMIFRKTVLLRDYLTESYLQLGRDNGNKASNLLQKTWEYINRKQDTTTSSALVAALLQGAIAPQILNIEHPHAFRIRDFQHGNVALLGGPWIDPWGQLFEDQLNFRVVTPRSKPSGSEILNLKPAPGEPKLFVPHTEGAFAVSYVRIALLPNLSNTGLVILMGANTDEALQAGGEFLVSHQNLSDLLSCFHVHSASELPAFEAVLEVRGVEQAPRTTRIIAYRKLTKPRSK